MTVIINELEVTTTSDEPQAESPRSQSDSPPTPSMPPFELRATLIHMARRAERLRAD